MKNPSWLQPFEDEMSKAALRADGPLVDVELQLECGAGVSCPPVRGKALVDTGADRTAIDYLSLDERAEPDGVYWAQGVTSEVTPLPIYSLKMGFPGSTMPEVEIERAAATPHLKSQGLVALLGRDVLEQTNLHYDGPTGTFTITPERGGAGAENALKVKPLPNYALGALAVGLLGGLAAWMLWPAKECPPCAVKVDAVKGEST